MKTPPLTLVDKGTPGSMRCAVLDSVGKIGVRYAMIPAVGPREVRVKITYVGICGSDLETYRGCRAPEFFSTPMRLGHEVAGVLDAVGSAVIGLQKGDQVTCRYVWGEWFLLPTQYLPFSHRHMSCLNCSRPYRPLLFLFPPSPHSPQVPLRST